MATSAAERQRRSRAHKASDHSLCDPNRCDGSIVPSDVTPSVTKVVTASRSTEQAQPRFGERGQRLWGQLNDGKRGPGEVVLIEEACRLADRLDRLDAVLAGDQMTWMMLRPSNDEGEVAIVVDAALSQARMHASTLKSLVAELRQSSTAAVGKPVTADQGDFLDQLAAKRAARIADAAGS